MLLGEQVLIVIIVIIVILMLIPINEVIGRLVLILVLLATFGWTNTQQ